MSAMRWTPVGAQRGGQVASVISCSSHVDDPSLGSHGNTKANAMAASVTVRECPVSNLIGAGEMTNCLTAVKAEFAAGPTFAVVTSGICIPSHRMSLREPRVARSVFATFAAAERLRTSARAGTVGQPLRGKNLALLLGASPGGDIPALRRAAQELGARVAELRFRAPAKPTSARDDVRALARMLGRMYDAVDCEALTPATVGQIEHDAGVPVCHGLCLEEHPARVVADLMTLHDHRSPPGASILFLGDPKAPRDSSFVSAARALGFEVVVGDRGRPASNEATFLVDARHSAHWSLLASTHALDEARRAENHRCVIQTVLLEMMIKA
jgi:ornithine carbamoyltransferase